MASRCCIHFLLVLMLLIFSNDTIAEEKLPILQTIGQEPYSFKGKSGKFEGYHYLIANAILQEAGYNAVAHPVPLKRLIRDVKEGLAHCMLAASSPFAKKNFTAVETIGHDLHVGILPRKGIKLHNYDDLLGLRIGVPAGMTIGDPFDSDIRMNKIATPDYIKSSLMLKRERIDAIMGGIESIRFSAYIAMPDEKNLFSKPLITKSYPFALFCNNKIAKTNIAERLGDATTRLKNNGSFDEIIGSFFARLPPL